MDSDREQFRFEASFHTAWKAGIQGYMHRPETLDSRLRRNDE
jgi:hypothetical protein